MRIYIDTNYPKSVFDILQKIHDLQKAKQYEIVRWEGEITDADLSESIFLVVDYQKKNLSIPILKLAASGYKTFALRVKENEIDRFEFMMTVLRAWPYILEKAKTEEQLFTFKYRGRKVTEYKTAS